MTEIEIMLDRVQSVLEQIKKQQAALDTAYGALQQHHDAMSASLDGMLASILQKVARSSSLKKLSIGDGLAKFNNDTARFGELVNCVRIGQRKLGELLTEHADAQKSLNAALPSFSKFVHEGRSLARPSPVFLAAKGGSSYSFQHSSQMHRIDPNTAVADVQLARRFQR